MSGFMRTATLALAVLASVSAIAAAPSGAAEKGRPEKTDLVFGIIPTMDYIPVELAIKRGFFKEEGLTVTTRVTPPGSTVPALIGGAIDVSGVNWIATIVAYNRNIPIQVIAEADAGSPGYVTILVKNDSPVRNLNDLVGKKVGAPSAPPGVCDVMVADTMGKPDASTGIAFTSIPVPQMMATLASGGVDAICLPEPLLTPVLQKKEARVVYDPFGGEHEGLPIVSYTVSAEFAKKNPNTVAALQRAIAKAQQLCIDDPNAVREVLPAFVHITPEQAKTVTLPKYVAKADPTRIRRLAEMLGKVGVLEKPVKVPPVGGQ